MTHQTISGPGTEVEISEALWQCADLQHRHAAMTTSFLCDHTTFQFFYLLNFLMVTTFQLVPAQLNPNKSVLLLLIFFVIIIYLFLISVTWIELHMLLVLTQMILMFLHFNSHYHCSPSSTPSPTLCVHMCVWILHIIMPPRCIILSFQLHSVLHTMAIKHESWLCLFTW